MRRFEKASFRRVWIGALAALIAGVGCASNGESNEPRWTSVDGSPANPQQIEKDQQDCLARQSPNPAGGTIGLRQDMLDCMRGRGWVRQ